MILILQSLTWGFTLLMQPEELTDGALLSTLGCGFYDTVEKLVEMGADMNARDIMACTPLQNAAHGTYSALAAVPAAGGATANGARPIRSGCVLLAAEGPQSEERQSEHDAAWT